MNDHETNDINLNVFNKLEDLKFADAICLVAHKKEHTNETKEIRKCSQKNRTKNKHWQDQTYVKKSKRNNRLPYWEKVLQKLRILLFG